MKDARTCSLSPTERAEQPLVMALCVLSTRVGEESSAERCEEWLLATTIYIYIYRRASIYKDVYRYTRAPLYIDGRSPTNI